MLNLVNDKDQVVQEALKSLAWRFQVDLENQVVYSVDVDKEKVQLISGGGSGHEPAQVGYLKQGNKSGLSAVVCGNLFASPSARQVSKALQVLLERQTGKAGVLLLVLNYTGDKIQFGKAMVQHDNVKMLIIDDDCSIPRGSRAGRRGIAGAVLVNWVLGNAVENGMSLQGVYELGGRLVKNMGSMGVAIRDGRMELGMGIHGEPGFKSVEKLSSIEVAKIVVDTILSQEEDRAYFKLEKDDRYGILINNLGSTTDLELGVFCEDVKKVLKQRFGKGPDKCWVGTFMTSLNMEGVSCTILKLESAWEKWLPEGQETGKLLEMEIEEENGGKDKSETVDEAIKKVCKALMEAREELTRLDSVQGDGDCGNTVYHGADYVLKHLDKIDTGNKKMWNQLSRMTEISMGGSLGGVLGILFTVLGKEGGVKGLKKACQVISELGGAKQGDRTILDVLIPMSVAGEGVEELIKAAEKGVEDTMKMEHAKSGRASYVGANLQGLADPGAKAMLIALQALKN